METFTLLFFVLMLLIAALLVTQTVRRDLKAREHTGSYTRRARTHAAQHALNSQPIQNHAHKSPPRTL